MLKNYQEENMKYLINFFLKFKNCKYFKTAFYNKISNYKKSMDELLMKQRSLKYYDQVKQGKYTMLCKQEVQSEQETIKQLDRLRALTTIIGKIGDEFPNLQTIIRRVEISVQTRLNQEEIGTDIK
jgi:hypothetical protein